MDISTVNIIICGIILIGLVSIFLNQIETNDNTQDKNYVLLDDEA